MFQNSKGVRSTGNSAYLGHNDDLVAVEIVLFDRLAQYDLRETVGVYVGCIKSVDSSVIPWNFVTLDARNAKGELKNHRRTQL